MEMNQIRYFLAVFEYRNFTHAAQEEAARPGANPVDLVDGEALCDLLKELKLGVRVTERTVEDITIDDDFFGRLEP